MIRGPMVRQAVILVGGLGTRLGALTEATPKPLLNVAGQPFLDHLIFELGRHGIRNVLLCAQFEAEQITAFTKSSEAAVQFGMTIDVSVEPYRAGTGGALFHARDMLHDSFLMMNGDSWLDLNLLALPSALGNSDAVAALALRRVDDASRFGVIEMDGQEIRRFLHRPLAPGPGLINAGIYFCRKQILDYASDNCSFEQDVLPSAAAEGRLRGQVFDGYFIDIGIPEAYEAAQTELARHRRRPAIFFDRDGVLNEDFGHVGSIDRFRWIDEAQEAVRYCNDHGYYVFIVTNQAGIGKGYYTQCDMERVHELMRDQLSEIGGHLDDIRFCPHHPDAIDAQFRRQCDRRKPAPGMVLDLMAKWSIDPARSFLIGDKQSDLDAAAGAGIKAILFEGGSLLQQVRQIDQINIAEDHITA